MAALDQRYVLGTIAVVGLIAVLGVVGLNIGIGADPGQVRAGSDRPRAPKMQLGKRRTDATTVRSKKINLGPAGRVGKAGRNYVGPKIEPLGDDKFGVPAKFAGKVRQRPAILKNAGALVAWSDVNGEERGLQLTRVRAGGLANAMGLADGDVIHTVNGIELTTPEQLAEEWPGLSTSDEFVLDVSSRGHHRELVWSVQEPATEE